MAGDVLAIVPIADHIACKNFLIDHLGAPAVGTFKLPDAKNGKRFEFNTYDLSGKLVRYFPEQYPCGDALRRFIPSARIGTPQKYLIIGSEADDIPAEMMIYEVAKDESVWEVTGETVTVKASPTNDNPVFVYDAGNRRIEVMATAAGLCVAYVDHSTAAALISKPSFALSSNQSTTRKCWLLWIRWNSVSVMPNLVRFHRRFGATADRSDRISWDPLPSPSGSHLIG